MAGEQTVNTILHQPEHRRHFGLTLAAFFAVSLIAVSWRGTAAEFLFAAAAGTVPALFWLWFWLKEDKIHPEPKSAIFKAFLFGALMVPLAIVLEQAADIVIREWFGIGAANTVPIADLPPVVLGVLFLVWAGIEEIIKYSAAASADMREEAAEYDEPIDAAIYLISCAIGFSAFESMFFVWQAVLQGGVLDALLLSQIRFLGAGLLHIVASSLVGFSLGFSFYQSSGVKKIYLCFGLLTAIALHAVFNWLILSSSTEGIAGALLPLWLSTIVIFLLFEKVKRVSPEK